MVVCQKNILLKDVARTDITVTKIELMQNDVMQNKVMCISLRYLKCYLYKKIMPISATV